VSAKNCIHFLFITDYLLLNIKSDQLEKSFNDSYKKIILFVSRKESKNNLSLDLSEIAKILEIDNIKNLLLKENNLYKLYNSLEICDNNIIINCKDNNLTFEEFSTYAKNELNNNNKISINVPNKINLYNALNQNENIFERLKQNYQIIKKFQLLILFIELIFILIIIFINWSNIIAYLKLLAIMFLAPSVTLLIISLLIYLNIKKIAETLVVDILSLNPNSIELDIIKINLIDILNLIIKNISIISLLTFLLGLILIIILQKLKNRRKYETQGSSTHF
jgi:hypothetical protein